MDKTIANLKKLKSFHNGSYGADIDKAIKALEQEAEYKAFTEWVAKEVFSDIWELNKDSFQEIACRKLNKLGIVARLGDSWWLPESEE